MHTKDSINSQMALVNNLLFFANHPHYSLTGMNNLKEFLLKLYYNSVSMWLKEI